MTSPSFSPHQNHFHHMSTILTTSPSFSPHHNHFQHITIILTTPPSLSQNVHILSILNCILCINILISSKLFPSHITYPLFMPNIHHCHHIHTFDPELQMYSIKSLKERIPQIASVRPRGLVCFSFYCMIF